MKRLAIMLAALMMLAATLTTADTIGEQVSEDRPTAEAQTATYDCRQQGITWSMGYIQVSGRVKNHGQADCRWRFKVHCYFWGHIVEYNKVSSWSTWMSTGQRRTNFISCYPFVAGTVRTEIQYDSI